MLRFCPACIGGLLTIAGRCTKCRCVIAHGAQPEGASAVFPPRGHGPDPDYDDDNYVRTKEDKQ